MDLSVAETRNTVAYSHAKVRQDNVYAHMWSNIASSNGIEEARTNRDIVAKRMTTDQLAEAQRLARECVKKDNKNCLISYPPPNKPPEALYSPLRNFKEKVMVVLGVLVVSCTASTEALRAYRKNRRMSIRQIVIKPSLQSPSKIFKTGFQFKSLEDS